MESSVKKYIFKFSLAMLASMASFSRPVMATQEGIIAPPPVKVVDDLGVNGSTGQPVQRLDTVSIGGENGLSHHIQVYANHFDAKAQPHTGYIDKYSGNARYVRASQTKARLNLDNKGILTPQIDTTPVNDGNYLWLMRVFGPVGSQDFVLNSDQTTFTAVGDLRHTLRHEIRNGRSTLIWRTPEGIESFYWATTGSNSPGPAGSSGKRDLRTIIYPNGLQIDISEGGVISNAGFVLKYGLPNPFTGNAWKDYHPSYIVGINLAEQYCSTARSASCNANGWPIARFNWPSSAPQAFYAREGVVNVFKVTDQHGGLTEFHCEAQNICRFSTVDISGESQFCKDRHPKLDQYLSPRLVAVKSANSDEIDYRYQYKNDGRLHSTSSGPSDGMMLVHTYWDISSKEGLLVKAQYRDRSYGYAKPMAQDQYGGIMSRGISGGSVDTLGYHPGVLRSVSSSKQGTFSFESNARNFVTSHSMVITKGYSYDSRGNLNRVTAAGNILQKAQYPSSCNNSNFRYCNKPEWVEDANGNRTDYTYHVQSGEIKTITKPAVKVSNNNIRPKATYNYSQLYAYYKKNSNTVERADSPIWKLTSEFTCRTSEATNDGCAGGDIDKVETQYYYGPQNGTPNNLFLRGVSVTAAGDAGTLETRVTCYEYDRYGNKIAETRPKGTTSLTSCP